MITVALGTGIGPPRGPSERPTWVRTVDGWQPAADLVTPPPPLPVLHPLVVAGTQLTASLAVLVAGMRD